MLEHISSLLVWKKHYLDTFQEAFHLDLLYRHMHHPFLECELTVSSYMARWRHMFKREENYTVALLCDPCQPWAKGGHLFFQVSKRKVQLFHICSTAHRPKQTLCRVGYLLFLQHLTRKETKAVGGQRQTDWSACVRGVSHSHSNTHTGWQSTSHTHPLLPTRAGSVNWSFNQNKDKEDTPPPDCNEGHKVWGTPQPLLPPPPLPHKLTQRLRKTTQLPPFSQSGNS